MKRQTLLFWLAVVAVLLAAIVGCVVCVQKKPVAADVHIETRSKLLLPETVYVDFPSPPKQG